MSTLRGLLGRVGGGAYALAVAVLVALGTLAVVTARPLFGWFAYGPGPDVIALRDVDPLSVTIGLVAALVAAALTLAPAVHRALARPGVQAVQLPGWPATQRQLPAAVVAVAAGGTVALVAVLFALGHPVAALVLAIVVAVVVAVLLAGVAHRTRDRTAARGRLTAVLSEYAPQVAVYTARADEAGYQLAMWLPELDAMGLRYVVVVRHRGSAEAARRLTEAPVVCCPTSADLDAVVVASLRVACYVNGIAQNVNFVGYRQLRHVYLGHGDSDKELSAHPAQAMFDEIFVAGPAAIERYEPAGVRIPAEKFVVVGRPQLAGIERATQPIAAVTAPRVLVAPTWRGYNTATGLGTVARLPQLVAALLDRGAVVQLRPHPFSRTDPADAAVLAEVDALLVHDRAQTGRPHVTSGEVRPLVEDVNGCDALVTDVGSVLVDFFATGKPYAVTLPTGLAAADAVSRFPSLAAAYLLTADDLAPLESLLGADPKSTERDAVAHHYLGDHPGDAEPFRTALRAALDHPRTPPASTS